VSCANQTTNIRCLLSILGIPSYHYRYKYRHIMNYVADNYRKCTKLLQTITKTTNSFLPSMQDNLDKLASETFTVHTLLLSPTNYCRRNTNTLYAMIHHITSPGIKSKSSTSSSTTFFRLSLKSCSLFGTSTSKVVHFHPIFIALP